MNNMNEMMTDTRTAPKNGTTPESIVSNDDRLVWDVIKVENKIEGQKKKFLRSVYTVACRECGYRLTAIKVYIEKRKACPGCSKRPAALKMDPSGHCISICEIGTVEFIREYQQEHSVSEREAVRHFVETAKAHLADDDPVGDNLTEESVRSSIRRATGKKKTPPTHDNSGADCPNNKEEQPAGSVSPTTPGKAQYFKMLAIGNLGHIADDDPYIKEALGQVIEWCHGRLNELEEIR